MNNYVDAINILSRTMIFVEVPFYRHIAVLLLFCVSNFIVILYCLKFYCYFVLFQILLLFCIVSNFIVILCCFKCVSHYCIIIFLTYY